VLVKLTLEGQDDTDTLRRKSAGSVRIRLLQNATLVCPSTRLRRLALEKGFSPDRVVHIPNGVDLSRSDESRIEGARPGLASLAPWNAAQLVFVGVVLERKGLHIVIEAMAELKDEYPSLQLIVVGEWPLGDAAHRAYVERLQARISSAGLAERVAIVGPVENPEEWLLRSSIFVLPSEAEGLPNALLEAMAAGLVPVVSDLPALHEVVDDRRNGLLVRERSSQAWAEAIRSLLREPASIETLGRAARATIRERYDLSVVAQSYLELFHRLVRK
jgi:glycosyltransferase involved in cell wall biosynthesis